MIHKDYVYRILKGNFEFWTIRGWGTISDLKAFSQPLRGGSILYNQIMDRTHGGSVQYSEPLPPKGGVRFKMSKFSKWTKYEK